MDLEDASAKLSASLKGNGSAAGVSTAQVVGFASQLQKTTGIATATTMAAAAGLARFQTIKGPNFTETIKQSANLAAVLGKDVVGATEMVGQALSDPRTGYLELASAGVAFSDSQIDAIQSMQAAGDLAGAQGVILDALKQQYDGAAEAAGDTLSGKLSILQGSFAEVAAVVGAAVAPALTGVIDLVTGWLAGLDKVAIANTVWEYTATAVGIVADTMQALAIIWKGAKVVMDLLLVGGVAGFRLLAQGVQAVAEGMAALGLIDGSVATGIQGFVDDVKGFEDALVEGAQNNIADLQKSWRKPWDSTQSNAFFDGIKDKSKNSAVEMAKSFDGSADKMAKAIDKPVNAMRQLTKVQIEAQQEATKLTKDLAEQLKYHGMDDYAKKAAQLQDKGATKGQVDQVKKLGAQLQGKDLALSLEQPFEKFEREMKKLTALKDAGGIDESTFARAQGKLVKDLQGAVPENKIQAGGPLAAGSQEARSAILSFRNAGRNSNPEEAVKRLQEQANEELKQQTRYLEKLTKSKPSTAAPTD